MRRELVAASGVWYHGGLAQPVISSSTFRQRLTVDPPFHHQSLTAAGLTPWRVRDDDDGDEVDFGGDYNATTAPPAGAEAVGQGVAGADSQWSARVPGQSGPAAGTTTSISTARQMKFTSENECIAYMQVNSVNNLNGDPFITF